MAKCKGCGGTGDQYDHEKDKWVSPREDCDDCGGWGEVDDDSRMVG